MSSERRTRLNWRSQKIHDLQTLETCLSRLRSSANVTPSSRTWSLGLISVELVQNGTDIYSRDSKAGGARIKFYIAIEKNKSKKEETTTVQNARASKE